MTYYIRVDHSKFEGAASAIESYISRMKGKMNSAEAEVNNLSAAWQGADSVRFKVQWEKAVSPDSTYADMKKSFETYAKFLRDAANRYKSAQANAINRANALPRW